MTKTERLKLENEVLKNILECIREELDSDDNYPQKTGAIKSIIDFDGKMEVALSTGYTIDYRRHKRTHGRPPIRPKYE